MIQRHFKQLSRIYHPDKSVSEKRAAAQQSFVAIKTAAEVLSDPVFRLAYDHGGIIAVTIVKRSQAAQHAQNAVAETRDENDEENNNFVDLYSLLVQAANEQEAASIVRQFVQEYQMHQKHISKPQFDLSYELPYVYQNTYLDQPAFQRDSTSFNSRLRYPVNSKVSASVGAGSDLQHTAEANINASFGLDFQPVRGTHVTADAALNHRTSPAVSLRTSRQSVTGTVLVAAIGGNISNRQSWNTSIISSKTILWESLTSSSSRPEPTKLQATWRIAFSPAGQLRYLMAGLRTLDFPVWGCRLCLGRYPVKIYWRGAETDTFYASYSWSIMFSRIKLLRISGFGGKWTFKYGLKYDKQAHFSGGSLWSVLCHVRSNELSLRIPIGLKTVSPVVWLTSLLVAEFVDNHLEDFQSKGRRTNENCASERLDTVVQQSSKYADLIKYVASKKRNFESSEEGGLVIVMALWQSGEMKYDVTDILQFWVVNSQLHMTTNDSRLWWQLDQQSTQPLDETYSTWWNFLGGRKGKSHLDEETTCNLTIRYQFKKSVFEISFCGDDQVILPNSNSTELGVAGRVS